MFQGIFSSTARQEADLDLKVEKIMDIIKSEKFDANKNKLVNRIRLRFQAEMERKHQEVSEHKIDLEDSLKELTSPINKEEIKEEKSRLEKFFKNVFSPKEDDAPAKVA